jgi:GntR family transcriptional regulator of vanillate catabolism
VKVQLRLREMILAGELQAGSRITELALVEKLGVSRTPIRAALIRL